LLIMEHSHHIALIITLIIKEVQSSSFETRTRIENLSDAFKRKP